MQPMARPSTVIASMPSTSTGRVAKSSRKPPPLRKVWRLAIWKKNGRLSLGGEMSSENALTAAPGPFGEVSAAKCGSTASRRVSTGVNSSRCASRAIVVRVACEKG